MTLFNLLMFILWIAVLSAPILVLTWFARIYRRRIRRWADERGYAIIRLTYKWLPNPIRLLVFDLGTWYVELQDEQGGIRRGYVHFPVPYLPPWIDVPWGKMQIEWR